MWHIRLYQPADRSAVFQLCGDTAHFGEDALTPVERWQIRFVRKTFESTLADRSLARATYHTLETSAGTWQMPLAIRGPMATWDFKGAESAMATAKQIVDVRGSIEAMLSGFSLDGTVIQRKFESAATQADLDSLLTLTKKEADAAGTLDRATKLNEGSRSILQSIGLIVNDIDATLAQARADLGSVKPDAAGAEAQSAQATAMSAGVAAVKLGGVSSFFTVTSDTQMSIQIPAAAASGFIQISGALGTAVLDGPGLGF